MMEEKEPVIIKRKSDKKITIEDQTNVILSLKLIDFNHHQMCHHRGILQTLRNNLVKFLPREVYQILVQNSHQIYKVENFDQNVKMKETDKVGCVHARKSEKNSSDHDKGMKMIENNHNPIREKDLYEAVGFSNGR